MSRLWANRLTLEVGPGGATSLAELPRGAHVTLILTSHHSRYAVLPWSAKLKGDEEWEAFARHRLVDTYGSELADWDVRVSSAPRGAGRVACALERSVLAELRRKVSEAGATLGSIQPRLMQAFNARRGAFRTEPGWLVATEPGRITLALIARGLWEAVRIRNVGPRWRDELPQMLRREEALMRRASPIERVVLA
ncbi:MAG: hypothetical protein ACRENK_08310 [Gemmatimonadaceae bacterium]